MSSYCETMGWNEKRMFATVTEKITNNTKLVMERAKDHDTRAAALAIAKERVMEGMVERGWRRK
ncbi:MAG: hypothetical protein NTY83_03700 [Candidatus Micrarchaeota archaeon]|nr:hypothetical protein [Candidatus Micrarchaeota archaeon]